MRIIWITSRHPPDRGGMAESSGRITNGLRDAGHQVMVLHLSSGASPPDKNGMTVSAGGQLIEPECLFWTHRNTLASSVLVGFGGNEAGYFATLWAGWLGTRSVVLFRGNDFDRNIHDARRAWMTHHIVSRADVIGAVSSEMAARIRAISTQPVFVTPNSIDCSSFRELPHDRDAVRSIRSRYFPGNMPVVGMFGELKSKKGFPFAVSLFSTFNLRRHARLLTVGSVPDTTAERCARDLGECWAHVPFTGRENLVPYYLACDAVFIPSLYDGMPNVLLEAMALGRVVVASGAGAMPDVITHGSNGFLFSINDHGQAAEELFHALSLDETARREVEEAARNTVERCYSPEHERSIIESMLHTSGKPA
jgi:glycogen(starch) synthase